MKMMPEKIKKSLMAFTAGRKKLQQSTGLADFGRKLVRDTRGMSGAIMVASVIPIIAIVGLATDVSRAYIVKQRLGTALDAAALAGGRVLNDTAAVRRAEIQQYFDANLPNGFMGATVEGPYEVDEDGNVLAEDYVYGNDEDVLRLKANADVNTVFLQLFGVDSLDVNTDAEVTKEISLLDVVVAIDLSGSMQTSDVGGGSRIYAAKQAAKTMINILFGNNAENPLLKIGVVPWSGAVNITNNGSKYGFEADGVTPLAAADLYTTVAVSPSVANPYEIQYYSFDKLCEGSKWSPDCSSAIPGNGYEVLKNYQATINNIYYAHNAPSVPLLAEPPTGWTGCVYARYAREEAWQYKQTPSSDNSTSLDEAADIYDGPVEIVGGKSWIGWYPIGDENEYSNYVAYDFNGDGSIGSSEKYYDGYRCDMGRLANETSSCTPCPDYGITKLQSVKQVVWDAIDDLDATSGGYTNIPQGLVWAWRVLSPGLPFNEASVISANSNTINRAIILLTDGENTRRSGDTYNRMLSDRNNRLLEVADAIKNDPDNNIQIYTIQFAESSGSLATLLTNVATDEDHYYFAPDAATLNTIFEEIANELSSLRLSK
ncbi:vWA domain-containing protein [Emcibacter nanhaiensis]|uniref:VWA domain-containing protein n=1 Tax=Emcibacter nanhaiensis TaxID=1505037 RepID=A0A501PG22_9PROT|nr:pilus assembly protein TadG-related protein [Emcibacter nanhaiensis]TPD59390.1 VWA domain-containing protein [Emcibacter nanhaiensis]